MNYLYYFIAAIFLLLVFSTLNLLRYRNKYSHLCRQQDMIDEKSRSVAAQYQQLKEKIERNRSFSNDLREADEATARLQLSRSAYHARAATASIPERYRYIRSHTGNGTKAPEIASLFSISKEEAEQLVALSQIGGGCEC